MLPLVIYFLINLLVLLLAIVGALRGVLDIFEYFSSASKTESTADCFQNEPRSMSPKISPRPIDKKTNQEQEGEVEVHPMKPKSCIKIVNSKELTFETLKDVQLPSRDNQVISKDTEPTK